MTLEAFAEKHGFSLVFMRTVVTEYDHGRPVGGETFWEGRLLTGLMGWDFTIEYRRQPRKEVRIISGPLWSQRAKTRKACRQALIEAIQGHILITGSQHERYPVPRNLS